MRIGHHGHRAPQFRVWTENVAGNIGDPVRRLRFLRAVAAVPEGRRTRRRRLGSIAILLAVALAAAFALKRASARPPAPAAPSSSLHRTAPAPSPPASEIWQVESRGDSEVYSNGLRIDNRYAVASHPRSYLAFPASGGGPPVRQTRLAGVVFHSTESRQLPFEAGHNEALKRVGESLLDYLRRRRSYHFLIDRFGRVYRIVVESDAADHAGYSVWGDDRWIYVNLNQSFLGVAFESSSRPAADEPAITPAQTRSAVMLAELLRARYAIPPSNWVTHAQVSVNPSNMRIGWHVDWATGFPFEQIGLPLNYAEPPPAIWAFGFAADPTYYAAAAPALRFAVANADALLARRAAADSLRPAMYRKRLQEQYRRDLNAVRRFSSEPRD